MPSTLTSDNPFFTWVNISDTITTVVKKPITKKITAPFKQDDIVVWTEYNVKNYEPTLQHMHSTIKDMLGKPLRVLCVYNPPYDYLVLVHDDTTGASVQVHGIELMMIDDNKFYENKPLIKKTLDICRDLQLLDAEFSLRMFTIKTKFLHQAITKEDFEQVKRELKPIIAFLKKEDSDEAEYLIEELREFLLVLSKDIKKEPKPPKTTEV